MSLRPSIWVALRLASPLLKPNPKKSIAQRQAEAIKADRLVAKLARSTTKPLKVEDHAVEVTGGSILVRSYTPAGAGPFGAHVYLHGGAFWLSSVDSYDALCRLYAAESGCVVISVDYRLAPEHKYPTQVEDSYAAWLWVHDHASVLGIDPASISIGGTSAGGSLAAATCLMARDLGGPMPILQLLEIPATDCGMDHASIQRYGEGYGLSRDLMLEAMGLYLADPSQADEPYASPLRAELSGLPVAFILTCECDPLRDQGEMYAARLGEAGVPVAVRRYRGHVHASSYMSKLFPSARRYLAEICTALQDTHAQGPAKAIARVAGAAPSPRTAATVVHALELSR